MNSDPLRLFDPDEESVSPVTANASGETLTGVVLKIFYSSPHFSTGQIRRNDGTIEKWAGKAFVKEGDPVTFRGKFGDDPKWGWQFKVESVDYEAPVDPAGLANWLSGSPQACGIGPVKANRLVEIFGSEFEWVLLNEPQKIADAVRVSLDKVKALAQAWDQSRSMNACATKLAAWGFTNHQITLLVERFGGSIIRIIESDPYLLVREVPGLGFMTIDAIALKRSVPKNHPSRIKAGILYALSLAQDNGSTCQRREELLAAAAVVLKLDELNAAEVIAAQLVEITGEEKSHSLRVACDGENEYFAYPGVYEREKFVSEFLRTGSLCNPCFPEMTTAEAISAVTGKNSDLDESQRRAVANALLKRISLISGGAGAGKTVCCRAIVGIFRDAKKKVLLLAPTGKAARRLQEVCGQEAATVHRGLAYHPATGFRFNKKNPLPVDVVCLDETSMASNALAYHLFSAIGPKTSVVLVGDHHQLPPVEAGALLRDCIARELIPLTLLSHCHRQAGPLKVNCAAILQGKVAPTEPVLDQGGFAPWYVSRNLEDPAEVIDRLERLFKTIIPSWGFDRLRDCQIMTCQHKGRLGTIALNRLLQKIHQESLGVTVPDIPLDKPPILLPGDKVIQTKNNYQLDVMNGNQGVVISNSRDVKKGSRLVVLFDGKENHTEIPRDCEGEVELAYCLTVHKMQGSQHPVAIFICHRSQAFMLNRNLLYTACTRAQQVCIVLGDERSGIRHAAERVVTNCRRTLLGLFPAVTGSET
jgi:exodeoxyribonuclease V alpha subunit